MPSLTAAHRGYEYQDLLVACRLVDMLLGVVREVHVDEKLVDDDRFDDLSTIDIVGKRERCQFKHTSSVERPLSLETFTTDRRDLRLDRILASILADRSGPGQHATSFSYRIILGDTAAADQKLVVGYVRDVRVSKDGNTLIVVVARRRWLGGGEIAIPVPLLRQQDNDLTITATRQSIRQIPLFPP